MFPPGRAADPLSAPPPSPTGMNPDGMGNAPVSMRGMAGPLAAPVPTNQLPPEVLTGIQAAAAPILQTLQSFAQFTPDKAPQLALILDLFTQYLNSIGVAGSQAVTPTATGPAFPGGGIDRGIAGAGAV